MRGRSAGERSRSSSRSATASGPHGSRPTSPSRRAEPAITSMPGCSSASRSPARRRCGGAGLRAQNERELGLIELSEERHAKARAHLSRSLGLCRSIGDRRDTRDVLVGMAALEVAEGAVERAETLLAAARALLDIPLDVRASLQGCSLSAGHLDEVAAIASRATMVPPLAAAQLDAMLRQASEYHMRGHLPTELTP